MLYYSQPGPAGFARPRPPSPSPPPSSRTGPPPFTVAVKDGAQVAALATDLNEQSICHEGTYSYFDATDDGAGGLKIAQTNVVEQPEPTRKDDEEKRAKALKTPEARKDAPLPAISPLEKGRWSRRRPRAPRARPRPIPRSTPSTSERLQKQADAVHFGRLLQAQQLQERRRHVGQRAAGAQLPGLEAPGHQDRGDRAEGVGGVRVALLVPHALAVAVVGGDQQGAVPGQGGRGDLADGVVHHRAGAAAADRSPVWPTMSGAMKL